MPGTVLFGDDGSASADLAWRWINAQQWRGWTVDALTAFPEAGPDPRGETVRQSVHPRDLLDPTSVAGVRAVGRACDPRVALMEHEPKDVIVIGPRGRGLLKALHLGSTAEWLMHDPPAPLVIARRRSPVRRAVVCTDGSTDAMAAASALALMPWLPDVDVTVVSVEQVGLDAGAAAERAAAVLQGHARTVTPQALGPTQTEVFYQVRDILLSFVEAQEPDLLVHGTRGLSRWAALRAGSIAGVLAAHAPCSVLMVHEHGNPGGTDGAR